jgi:hypothetical protein
MFALFPEAGHFGKPLEVPEEVEWLRALGSQLVAEIVPISFSVSRKLDHHHGLELAFARRVFRASVAFPGAERGRSWRSHV